MNRAIAANRIWTTAVLAVSLLLGGCTASPAVDTGTQPPAGGGGQSSNGPDKPQTEKPAPQPERAQNPEPVQIQMGKVTAVRLADPQKGWVGGNGWIARTDDGGKHWTGQYQGPGLVKQLFALNENDAWAALADKEESMGPYRLIHTENGGKTWSDAGEVPNAGFLHFVSKTEAYSGDAKTTDGGQTWTKLGVPDQLVGEPYFRAEGIGWAVTQSPNEIQVQRTGDGGQSWQPVWKTSTAVPATGAIIRSAGKEDAWVELIGGSGMSQTSYSVFHTSDGGKQWRTVIANSTAGAGPAPGIPADQAQGKTNKGSKPGPLYVVSPEVAFMGGQCPACDKPNTIGWTRDGGKTWTVGKQELTGYGPALLAMADAERGWWLTTDNTDPSVMYTTSDGGQSWTKVYTFGKPE
ncbi:hypothetical protein SAMN02799630_05141 [Paenibacillus sp. UNCCL117]|uniref:WD40/YVTN/BNR-like repeat-containing protein n=1 Tax=unclassified Paenibacillus TaxID=185978 RepID=UPI00088EB9B4|nr:MULTISPECIES: hypothetical protein [unclassified Paenibacillus]SDE28821.1 hypothetical protein SAMN04488602_12416 [Paenibacillus sp. cl123]SFW63394.1 hypothetical protein SAMN02799630_05141 [Paenibacillus sp. UNCCL117]